MMVKQIDLQKALELAGKGKEILVMVPAGPDAGWTDYTPDTLLDMLEGCLFFRREPAMEKSSFTEPFEAESHTPPPM